MRIFKKALLSLSLILFYANNAYATTTGTYPVEESSGSGKLVLLIATIGLVALVLFIGYKMDKSEAQEKRKEKIIKKRNNDENDIYSNIYNSHELDEDYEDEAEEYNAVSEETAVVGNVYSNLEEMETGYEEEILKSLEEKEFDKFEDDFDKTAVIEKIDLSKFENDANLTSEDFEETEELEEDDEIEDDEIEDDEEDYEEIEEEYEEIDEEDEIEEADEDYEDEELEDEYSETEEEEVDEVVETDLNKKYKITNADDIDVYDNYEATYYDYESSYDSTMVFDSAPTKKESNILEKFSDVKGYDFEENDREVLDLEKIVTDVSVKKFTRKKDNKVKSKKAEKEPEIIDSVVAKKYTRKKLEKIETVVEEKPKRGRKPAAKKETAEKQTKTTRKTEKASEEKPKRGRKPATKKEDSKKTVTEKAKKTAKTSKTTKKEAEEKPKRGRKSAAKKETTEKKTKTTKKTEKVSEEKPKRGRKSTTKK